MGHMVEIDGKSVEIPDGYRLITSGEIKRGDMFFSAVGEWKPTSAVGYSIEDASVTYIRKVGLEYPQNHGPIPEGYEIVTSGQITTDHRWWREGDETWASPTRNLGHRVENFPSLIYIRKVGQAPAQITTTSPEYGTW